MSDICRYTKLKHRYILGMRVDATSYNDAIGQIMDWGKLKESRYVCVANVHMAMEAYDSDDFRRAVNSADLVTPDGMPLVWGLRLLGVDKQERVCGPELTPLLLECAAEEGVPVGFFGGSSHVLEKLLTEVRRRFPKLKVNYAYSPPFHPISDEEDDAIVHDINASGTCIIFVGLGCPKQELWMARHKTRLQTVQIGVGAAFDFIAGTKQQAPLWMRNSGFEWLFRLMTEPRRLMGRYLKHNPRFLFLFGGQVIESKRQKN